MVSFYLSLGANLGDRLENIKKAIRLLKQVPGTRLDSFSSVYETDPVGFTDQPPFLNMVLGGYTLLSAEDLLRHILDIERKLGRIRELRWGPRIIDIDILTYGREIIQTAHLQIPHPRMLERLFVLIPMREIAARHRIPVGDQQFVTPEQQLEKVTDKSGVRIWKSIDWETELELTES